MMWYYIFVTDLHSVLLLYALDIILLSKEDCKKKARRATRPRTQSNDGPALSPVMITHWYPTWPPDM